jgi:hypothetical protein
MAPFKSRKRNFIAAPCISHLSHACYIARPSQFLVLMTLIMGLLVKSTNYEDSIFNFLQVSVPSTLIGSNILLRTVFSTSAGWLNYTIPKQIVTTDQIRSTGYYLVVVVVVMVVVEGFCKVRLK